MAYTVTQFLILLVIAAACGAIGSAIGGGVRGGFLLSSVLGFVGAIVGPWIAAQFGLPEPFMVHIDGHPFPLLWSVIGAAVVVALIHLFSRR